LCRHWDPSTWIWPELAVSTENLKVCRLTCWECKQIVVLCQTTGRGLGHMSFLLMPRSHSYTISHHSAPQTRFRLLWVQEYQFLHLLRQDLFHNHELNLSRSGTFSPYYPSGLSPTSKGQFYTKHIHQPAFHADTTEI
jgi:hypothetical protein